MNTVSYKGIPIKVRYSNFQIYYIVNKLSLKVYFLPARSLANCTILLTQFLQYTSRDNDTIIRCFSAETLAVVSTDRSATNKASELCILLRPMSEQQARNAGKALFSAYHLHTQLFVNNTSRTIHTCSGLMRMIPPFVKIGLMLTAPQGDVCQQF